MRVINFIQDIPTPHNNTLIRALHDTPEVKLNLWYAQETHEQYGFSPRLAHEVKEAKIYGTKNVGWALLMHAFLMRKEHYFLVGWTNITTRIMIFIFWLFRFPYNMWFDCPEDGVVRGYTRRTLRDFSYWMLKTSKAKVFCVGKSAVEYFKNRGFESCRLVNLPILVEISKTKSDFSHKRNEIRSKYDVNEGDLFLTAGSRLIYQKGFDLLIEALNKLPAQIKKKTKTLIVGKGNELSNLIQLTESYQLTSTIFFEEWMDIEDFKACIASSDIFIHPARFDAYGGGTLTAMSLGVPVIGSYQAGSAWDQIQDGYNGFLYDCQDVDGLAKYILYCHQNLESLPTLGKHAHETLEQHSLHIAHTFVENIH